MNRYFSNRNEAGRKLASRLEIYKGKKDVVVLGLARGGIIIAAIISKELKIPFDIIMTRKIGSPLSPELAIGAITETGEGYFNQDLIEQMRVDKSYIDRTISKEKNIANDRLALYRKHYTPTNVQGKIALIVDDGIATGATMMAAVLATKAAGAKSVIVAVPVASKSAEVLLSKEADTFISLFVPLDFYGVSQFYDEFEQVEDAEIITLLEK